MIFFRFPTLLVALSCTALSLADDLRLDGGPSGWERSWSVTTDRVMGGRSDASVSFENSDAMVFSGNINVIGGGFAYVGRTVSADLSSYAGIVVEVEAEGWDERAPLALNLQLEDGRRCSFSAAFAVPLAKQSGEIVNAFLPLGAFDKGGRWNCSYGKLDMSSIRAMRFYVLYQEGRFEARIRSVSAVEAPRSSPTPAVSFASRKDVETLLINSIESGERTYDAQYRDLCIAIYRSALDSLAASAGFSGTCSGMADFPEYAVGYDAERTLGSGLRVVINDVLAALSENPKDDVLGLVLDEAMGCCVDEMKKCPNLAKKGRCDGWMSMKKEGVVTKRLSVKNHCPKSCGYCADRCGDDTSFFMRKTVKEKTRKFKCTKIPNKHVRCNDMTPKKQMVREFCRESCNFCG